MPAESPVSAPLTVGGQAVIEGVMMRSPRCLVVAARHADGRIVVRDQPWRPLWQRLRFLRWPFLRGGVVLAESLANGLSALSWSAELAEKGLAEKERAARGPDAAPQPEKERKPISPWLILVPTLLVTIAIFKGVPHLVALGLDNLAGGRGVAGPLFHVVDAVAKLALFFGYIVLISRMKEIQRVFAYHGAEHKAIATYEAKAPLTVENARGKPRLHPRCGTSFLLVVILVGMLLYMFIIPPLTPFVATGWLDQLLIVVFKIALLFPIAGLSYEAIRLSARHGRNPLVRAFIWPGLMTQRLTTREPSDDQLEVALASIESVIAREAEASRPAAEGMPAAAPGRELAFADFAAFREAVAAGRR